MKKMKMFISLIAAAILLVSGVSSYAEEYTPVNLLINGQSVSTDQPAVIYNSRTVVPIRVIAETFECDVDWIDETKTVVISQGGASLYLNVGSNVVTAEMDGESASMEIDATPVIINNRTMVPIAFISELFGYNADWDANTKTVNISENTDTFSEFEYADSYFEATDRYLACQKAIADKIDDLTDEQVLEYLNIEDKYSEYISDKEIGAYTAEDVEYINKLAEELENFASKIGIEEYGSAPDVSTDMAVSAVYYVNPVPFNTDGGFSTIIDEPYNGYSDEAAGIDEDTAIYMLNTFNVFSQKMQENTDKMNSSNQVIFTDFIDREADLHKTMEEYPENTYTYAILINGISAELGAMAEGLNIDIGEDMKQYNVTVNNDVYSSVDIVQVRDAYYDALEKHNDYDQAISIYSCDFTSQQQYEYSRITETKTYYDLNQRDKESIDYYRGGLILLERSNKRVEIFADKYGIDL